MEQKRLVKKRRPWLTFLKVLLILVVLGSLSAGFIINFCATKDVKVQGNKIAKGAKIKEAVLVDKYDTNAVYATVRCFFSKKATIPFVESYFVSMKNLNTLVITVKEKELSGYLLNEKKNKYVYYGPDGDVQEISKRHIKGTFFVDGLVAKKPEGGGALAIDETDQKTIRSLQTELEREKLNVKKVHFSEDGIITFKVRKVLVNLGTRTAVGEKVRRLKYILPKLKGMSGTLHLEEWSEENTDIVFEKGV